MCHVLANNDNPFCSQNHETVKTIFQLTILKNYQVSQIRRQQDIKEVNSAVYILAQVNLCFQDDELKSTYLFTQTVIPYPVSGELI